MLEAAERAAERERLLRANGIPVSQWRDDETLMRLYSLEISELRQAMLMQKRLGIPSAL